jgi:hypothetical protein
VTGKQIRAIAQSTSQIASSLKLKLPGAFID